MKPFAESCERNKEPILAVLRELFSDRTRVLELASGTGQHATYFGHALPHLVWQTSELPEHHAGIKAWLDEARLPNVLPPLSLDVSSEDWTHATFDAVFNANTVHIIGWAEVVKLFEGVGKVLEQNGLLCLYGPFNYEGSYTAESNARFDQWLKARDPVSGIRDFEAVDVLAAGQGLKLQQDYAMPANNRLLVWRRMR